MLAFLCLICVALPPCLDCSRRSSLALLLHSFPVSVRPSVSVSVSVSVCRGVSIKVTKQQRQCSVLMLQQVMLLSPPLYHTHEHAILQSAQKQWEHTFSMTPFCTHTGARAHTHAHAHTHTHTHTRTHTHTHTHTGKQKPDACTRKQHLCPISTRLVPSQGIEEGGEKKPHCTNAHQPANHLRLHHIRPEDAKTKAQFVRACVKECGKE